MEDYMEQVEPFSYLGYRRESDNNRAGAGSHNLKKVTQNLVDQCWQKENGHIFVTFLELCDPAPNLMILSNHDNDGGSGDDDDVDDEDSPVD